MALQSDSTLPRWSVRLIDELESMDRRATALARGLGAAQLNWRVTEGSWSVGQCLQHLLSANEVYLPPIADSLENQPRSPIQDITPGWFGRWFIRNYIEPSPESRRATAPRKIKPAERIEPSVLELFLRSNDVARDLVRRAAAHDVNRIRFRNPFVPLVRFTVGTGLQIISRHQHRHLLQAERVRQDPNFPE